MGREQRRLALWQAFITFYMTVTAGTTLADVVGPRVAGLLVLLAAAMNAATTTYVASMRPVEGPVSAQPPPGQAS